MTKVVYISGAARSGSTLLGEILGAQPRVLDAGEISLFWRDAARGNRCACGAPIPDCPLWGTVLDRLGEEIDLRPDEYAELARTRADLSRTSRPLRLLRIIRDPARRTPAERRLVQASDALLESALDETGSDVVVDASKTLPGLLFHRLTEGVDVTVVHLIRHAPAVVASTLRSRAVERGNDDSLPPGGSLSTALGRWLWSNATASAGRRLVDSAVKVDYEWLAGQPEEFTRDLCQRLAIEFSPATVAGHELRRTKASHAAVGNPSRGGDVTTISYDERWRSELTPMQARVTRAVTGPAEKVLGRRTQGRQA